jgi:hypothetical protein
VNIRKREDDLRLKKVVDAYTSHLESYGHPCHDARLRAAILDEVFRWRLGRNGKDLVEKMINDRNSTRS